MKRLLIGALALVSLFSIGTADAGKFLRVVADSTDLSNQVYATEAEWTRIPINTAGHAILEDTRIRLGSVSAGHAIVMIGVSGGTGGTGWTVRGFAAVDNASDPFPEMITYREANDVAGVAGLSVTAAGSDSTLAAIRFGDEAGLLPPYLVLKLAEDLTAGVLWVRVFLYE